MTTYLIDASIYIFRAYFSYPTTWYSPQGYETNAVYGFARFLDSLFRQKAPRYCAAAFDESLGTCFRNELYPDYKSSRVLPDESLAFQLAACRQLAELAGIACFADARYEADDLIASLTSMLPAEVVIITRDKDLGQLLTRDTIVCWDPADDKYITRENFLQSYGVAPEKVVDFLALTGDKIDDVPGVPGVGAKTAAALLHYFDSVEDLFARIELIQGLSIRGAKTLASKLAPWHEQVVLAKQLVNLKRDVQLIDKKSDLALAAPDKLVLRSFLCELGISRSAASSLFVD